MSKKWILASIAALMIGLGAATAQEASYTVQRGDNLTRIAQRYNVTVQAIITRNNLTNPSRVLPGQVLIIPTGALQPLQPTAPGTGTVYTVQRGDTLNIIGARYGLTWRQIGAFNNLATPNTIFAGQVLQIPPVSYVSPAAYLPNVNPGQGGGAASVTLTYIVRVGDTLATIAQANQTTPGAIIQASNLTATTLIPGQVLLVPTYVTYTQPAAVIPSQAAVVPQVKPQVQPVAQPNTAPIYGNRYIVQAGDTLIHIGRRAGRSPWTIAAANGIYNLNHIFIGQVLIIR